MNNSVDDKNKALLEEIQSAGVQIEFEVKPDFDNWAVQSRPKYLIVANNEDPNPEMLAHELLHIKINLLGFISTRVITDIFVPTNTCFATKELSNMQNLLGHIRMLPLFIEMGYDAEKFTANHGTDFFINELLPSVVKVKAFFEINKNAGIKPTVELITEFLTLIICLKTYEVENNYVEKKFDTTFLKSELQSTDEALFNTLYEELTAWVDIGTYQNYQLYVNLSARLQHLGYPTEAEWKNWMLS